MFFLVVGMICYVFVVFAVVFLVFDVFALDVVDFFGTVFVFDAVILFSPSTYSKSKNLSFSCCAH